MQLYTKVLMLKYSNKQYTQMTNEDIEAYDADDVSGYDGAVVTDTQHTLNDSDVDMLHGIDSITLYTDMYGDVVYNNCLQVYYMHNGNGTFTFYVKTAELAALQTIQLAA